jgi:hypothetical protein
LAAKDLKIPSIFRPKSLLHHNAGDAVVRMVIRTPEDVPALAFRRALDAPKACALTKRLPAPQDSVNRGTLTTRWPHMGKLLSIWGSGLAGASVFTILDLCGLSPPRSSSSTFNLTFGRRSDGCTMIPLAAGKGSER